MVKKSLISGMTALALMSSQTLAQEATMDPTVIEEQAASSAQSLIVPMMLALVFLAVMSQATEVAPVIDTMLKPV